MNRTVLKTLCIVSGIVFAALAVLVILAVVQFASVGIIGGADGPTAIFLTQRLMATPVFIAMRVAFLAFVGTGIAWLITGKTKR